MTSHENRQYEDNVGCLSLLNALVDQLDNDTLPMRSAWCHPILRLLVNDRLSLQIPLGIIGYPCSVV